MGSSRRLGAAHLCRRAHRHQQSRALCGFLRLLRPGGWRGAAGEQLLWSCCARYGHTDLAISLEPPHEQHEAVLAGCSIIMCRQALPPPPVFVTSLGMLRCSQVEIGQCLQRCRAERLDRDGTLYRLATTVEGVYVPQVSARCCHALPPEPACLFSSTRSPLAADHTCLPRFPFKKSKAKQSAPPAGLTVFAPPLAPPPCTLQYYDAPGGWGGAVFPNREGVPERVKRRVCAPDPFQQIGLVPFVDTVHNRLTVEIRRGCTRGCRRGGQRGGSGPLRCLSGAVRAPGRAPSSSRLSARLAEAW